MQCDPSLCMEDQDKVTTPLRLHLISCNLRFEEL